MDRLRGQHRKSFVSIVHRPFALPGIYYFFNNVRGLHDIRARRKQISKSCKSGKQALADGACFAIYIKKGNGQDNT